jgi:hypothetical protein
MKYMGYLMLNKLKNLSQFSTYLFLSLLFALYLFAIPKVLAMNYMQKIVKKYDAGIDQIIKDVITPSNKKNDTILIVKKYLEPRKAKVDIERSQYIEYWIVDGKNEFFLTKVLNIQEPQEISVEKTVGGLIVSFNLNDRLVEKYKYRFANKNVEKIQRVQSPELKENESNSDVSSPFISLESRSILKYKYINKLKKEEGNKTGKDIVLYEIPGAVLTIMHIYEMDDMKYVFGSGYKEKSKNNTFIWLVAFKPLNPKFAIKASSYDFNEAAIIESSFISSTHSKPAIHLIKRMKGHIPPENYIFDGNLKVVWKNKASKLLGEELSIIGVCNSDFLITEKVKSGKVSDSLSFSLVNRSGLIVNKKNQKIIENGLIGNVVSKPKEDASALIFINFTQMENVRRKDGWYSWNGYRVDELGFDCDAL